MLRSFGECETHIYTYVLFFTGQSAIRSTFPNATKTQAGLRKPSQDLQSNAHTRVRKNERGISRGATNNKCHPCASPIILHDQAFIDTQLFIFCSQYLKLMEQASFWLSISSEVIASPNIFHKLKFFRNIFDIRE